MSIRMQADEFFNAYLVLKESDEATIKKLQILSGKPLIRNQAFGAFPAMVPSIVCLSFSVELYIKEVYNALGLKPPRGRNGHHILTLFDNLPDDIKQDIFWNDAISQNPFMHRGDLFSPKLYSSEYKPYDRFRDQIKAISDAFVEWRYSHEHVTLKYDTSLAIGLIEALQAISDNVLARSKADLNQKS